MMTSISADHAPLRNLVFMMIALAVLGTATAGLHWALIDNPAQQATIAPENSSIFPPSCMGSQANCVAWCNANQHSGVGSVKCLGWCRSQC
jgi:hypothetical protein